jgi:hypothetical protein
MRWTHAILAAALLAGGIARAADDPRQTAQEVMREALLRHATLPTTPPMLPDRGTVLPGSAPGTHPPRPPPRGSPTRDPGPRSPNGMRDAKSGVAAVGARDGSAMRDEMRAGMARAAQSRMMTHGARDANAMRGEAAHRSSMGFGMGAMPGVTGQQGGWGTWGCQDGAGMWRTMNPTGGMMTDGGMTGGMSGGGGMGGGGMHLVAPGAAFTPAPGR